MTAGLPEALRHGIEQIAGRVRPSDIADRAGVLSETYRGGGNSSAVRGDAGLAAYVTARLPATYAAMASALRAVSRHAPLFSPQSILDAGAGPGTASWAAAACWPDLQSITMMDTNPHLIAVARELAAGSPIPALHGAQFVAADVARFDPAEGHDAVLAGYALGELPAGALAQAVARLWQACRGVLVLVEPGTPAGFARIRDCRTQLLSLGARIVAPCPGAYACPIHDPDWCHFSVRLPRSRAHMRAKGANVPFEDERFSYLAVARDSVEVTPAPARILAQPRLAKPGITLRLCADGTIAERQVPKRDKPAYKTAVKLQWGDAF